MEDIRECGSKEKDEYIFVKCRNCGKVFMISLKIRDGN